MRMDQDGKYLLAGGSALYSDAVGLQKVLEQEKSTDVDASYCNAGVSGEHVYAAGMEPYARDWKELVVKKLKGVLRLHFLFPHAVKSAQVPLCSVKTRQGRQEITINIDKTVFQQVFSRNPNKPAAKIFSAIGNVFAKLSGTRTAHWGDHSLSGASDSDNSPLSPPKADRNKRRETL
jgi:hypothetical protein